MKKYIILAVAALSSSILTLALAALFVMFYIVQPFQKEAVDRGFAAWNVTNNGTGATVFAWLEMDKVIYGMNADIFEELAQPLPQK